MEQFPIGISPTGTDRKADQEDSLIVSVTVDGRVYFGVNPISPAALAEKIKGLSGQTEKSSTLRRMLVLRMPTW
jgi:biopolymer transport protein ExbD